MTAFQRATVQGDTRTLPGHYYTSAGILQQEMQRIFYQQWLCVGREEQISEPGDYFLVTIGQESIIVLRDRAGQPRAFFNVCRHRGTRLCTQEQGHFTGPIQCPYHAWTYGLDGQLTAARLMQEVLDFDKRDYPLYPAALASWEGFLFLNLAPEPEPFHEAFAPLIDKFTAWGIPELRVARRIEYDVQANWKLIFENYSECYHCPLVHPALDRLSHSQSGRNDLIEGPFLGGYMTMNRPGTSLTTTGQRLRAPISTLPEAEFDRVYYYTIFPSLLFSPHSDCVMAHRILPQSCDRTRIVCEWLFTPEAMAQPGFDPSDVVDFWDLTNRQDWKVSELTQLGVNSRAYTPGPLAHQEGLIDAFDRHYLRLMGH